MKVAFEAAKSMLLLKWASFYFRSVQTIYRVKLYTSAGFELVSPEWKVSTLTT